MVKERKFFKVPVKKYLKSDFYRPNAKILKLKGETPSVLEIAGNRYILDSRADDTRHRRKQYENRTCHAAVVKKRKGEIG